MMIQGLTPTPAFAQSAATSKIGFCTKSQDRSWFQQVASEEENHLSFKNRGGIGNGGVCWWHSRLTRAANYLAVYRPDLPKPNAAQVRAILWDLQNLSAVVEIPGYSSLSEFSHDWESTIQKLLEAWQRNDGIWRLAWIRGLYNSATPNAQKMERTMEELFEDVESGHRITYLKVQIPGIPSHAWLITSAVKTDEGYDLQVIDSNYLDTQTYHYKHGDAHLSVYDNAMPYIEQMKDFAPIDEAIAAYCAE